MSASLRHVRSTLQVHHFSLLSSPRPHSVNFSLALLLVNRLHSSSSSSSFYYLNQFSPFSSSNDFGNSLAFVNSSERRSIVVGLSKIIKRQHGYALSGLSQEFCPYFLVKIMILLESRETAFAFFKFAFGDCSDSTARSACIVAHVLAAAGLRYLAQDVVSWVMRRIGEHKSEYLVRLMWAYHHGFESDFSVLDTLLRAFVNVDSGLPAVRILGRMREVGLMPSLSAMARLFRLLLRGGDYDIVWKLFRGMIHEGPRPVVYIFNVIINGFCKQGFLIIGESLLHIMRKFGCEPDVVSYNTVINACCLSGQTSDAFAWVQLMIGRGCAPSIATFNTIINALCNEGNVVAARKVFDGISEIGLSPNVVLYNTLLNGYVKAGDIPQADRIFEEMRNGGIAPDGITFNILIAGHYKYCREVDGNKLLSDLLRLEMFSGQSLYYVSLAWLCWEGRLDVAMKVLNDMIEKGMTPSVVTFNLVISAFSKAGMEDAAYEVYKLMVKVGLVPSSSTCGSLLIGLSNKGRLEEGRELLYRMREVGYMINRVAFTVLLDGYFRIGDLAGAKNLWTEMQRRGMFPDLVAFSAYIDGVAKAGHIEEACEVFVDMLSRGYVPNNFVYNSLIGGFCMHGMLDKALKLEKEMRQKGLLPDVFTFNIIINGFCKLGRMKLAHDAFIDMLRMGLTPDIVTYNTLIDGYCKAFDIRSANNFMNKMFTSGRGPDITTYNICMNNFCSTRKMNRAVMLLDELISVGIPVNTVTYNTIVNGVCGDILDRAMIIAAKLLKIAFMPNTITINVLLSQFCKQGMPDRALMWGQKLSKISFDFDEVSHMLLSRAYQDMNEGSGFLRETSRNSLFLDFLMFITYDYFSRNKHVVEMGQHTFRLIEDASNGSETQLKATFLLRAWLWSNRRKMLQATKRYKLAQRLLHDNSANNDHKRSSPTKLKQQCGVQFTSRMEGMVTDSSLARKDQSSFEKLKSIIQAQVRATT